MPQPQPVILAKYDPEWPKFAAKHADDLRALGPTLVSVHHIGSTAVPGLAAKPIIDLLPVVTSLNDLDRERGRIEALGYVWHGEFGIPGRRYCDLSSKDGVRIVQIHFFKSGSPDVTRHLAFRDYLRAHPNIAAEYEHEKRRARDLHPNDSGAYCEKKGAWVQKTQAAALIWFGEQQHGYHH